MSNAERRSIKTILDTIVAPLLERHGVGYETAGALLTAAGDNPERLGHEGDFPSLWGAAPVPHRGGDRVRLNRGGDRQDNSALWTIVMTRIRSQHPPTIAYLERRVSQGKTKRAAIRCLKRYVARQVFNDIRTITTSTLQHAA